MSDEQKEDFNEWWDLVGSSLAQPEDESEEDHAKRVAFRAWSACVDINNIGD